MTYIRLTGGRDRGEVKDMPFNEAQEMLSLGQALPVNFDEPDPLGFRELPRPIQQAIEEKEISILETALPRRPALTEPLRRGPAERFKKVR